MPQARLLILLIMLVGLVGSAYSQTLSDPSDKNRNAMLAHDYSTALRELSTLRSNSPDRFIANNYDYLLARLSDKNGDFATALTNYQSVVSRNSVLKEYALWHLSQIMRNSGNLLVERLYLKELSTIPRESLLRDAAWKRLAKSNFDNGNYKASVKYLTFFDSDIAESDNDSKSDKIPSESRKDLVLLARAHLLNGDPIKAKEIFTALVENSPKPNQPDDFALAGVKGLDLAEVGAENFGKQAPKLSADEHFKRAKIYQFNRNFARARIHYEAIANGFSENENAPVAIFQIGRGFGQVRDYENAVKWFERLQKEFPEDKFATLALYNSASAFANLEKTQESVSRYTKYIEENTDAKNLERAHLNIIDAYRDAGDNKKALEWASTTQNKFRDEMGEAVALFSQIRIRISQRDWQNALGDLNRLREMKNLGGVRIAGGTNKNEVEFLRGYVLEKLQRYAEAIELYLSIPDGRKEYYGWRSAMRLKSLAANDKTKGLISERFKRRSSIADQTLTSVSAGEIRIAAQNAFRLAPNDEKRQSLLARIGRANSLLDKYKEIPAGTNKKFGRQSLLAKGHSFKGDNRHQILADELIFLGLYDEGTPELESALRKELGKNGGSLSDFDSDTAFTLAEFYRRGDIANRAIRHIEGLWRKLPRDFPIELIPREHLELLYPKPYEASLVKYGKEKNVDPRFVLSIMRQESRFQANVKSVAAARGLMQFISNTSNQMAEEMKIENFEQDDLYNPPTAIRFGSHYIEKIFKDFPDKPEAVAASYNGGEDRMMRWFKRANSDDPDRFVPEIIFSQTKDYAYKVIANYRIYKILYDENLTDLISSKKR